MDWIDFSRWDVPALTDAWRSARPFPHIIIDDLVPEEQLQALRIAVSREPHTANVDHFYEFMGSGLPVLHPVLHEFSTALGSPAAVSAIAAISDRPVRRVEMRSYVYLAGSFLLPHSDFRPDLGRLVAYAYYLLPRETSVGGELELFECEADDAGDVVATRSTRLIEPGGNRMVIFNVSPTSLHQVREVTGGGRVSLSGWFFGDDAGEKTAT